MKKTEKKVKKNDHAENGKFLSGNTAAKGSVKHHVIGEIRHIRKAAAKFLVDDDGLTRLINLAKTTSDAKEMWATTEILLQLVVPKLQPEKVLKISDLDDADKQKLELIKNLPPEKQAQKIIELYVDGTIDAGIATTLGDLIKSSQQVQDERVQQLLARYEEDNK